MTLVQSWVVGSVTSPAAKSALANWGLIRQMVSAGRVMSSSPTKMDHGMAWDISRLAVNGGEPGVIAWFQVGVVVFIWTEVIAAGVIVWSRNSSQTGSGRPDMGFVVDIAGSQGMPPVFVALTIADTQTILHGEVGSTSQAPAAPQPKHFAHASQASPPLPHSAVVRVVTHSFPLQQPFIHVDGPHIG